LQCFIQELIGVVTMRHLLSHLRYSLPLGALCSSLAISASATDKALLDILFGNGLITDAQYEQLLQQEEVTTAEVLSSVTLAPVQPAPAATEIREEEFASAVALDENVQRAIDDAVTSAVEAESPVLASYGSKGFRFETRDGNWQTNLQWRAQLRYSNPYGSDPRQMANYEDSSGSSFEQRRLRMKIGGHGFKPWIKYYFEVDLQPARDVDADAVSSGARVIDWRIDLAKWDWGGIRMGQWKVDLNRERVDSSGRQQFVERSIVNRIFTMDRQVGIQLRGRLFEGTMADMRYYAGVFNGEGRGVKNNSTDHLYMGRLQWNFLGRDLPWKQTDVEYTDKPTGSFAVAGFTNTGPCTRWSSSGCGNLDGFSKPVFAEEDQFKIEQAVQEFAFKYRGLSIQQEWHRKFVTDRVMGTESDLTGFYLQSGYFLHNLIDAFPAPLELAARYAYVSEPNKSVRSLYNEREEFTLGANWFFSGHSNKITVDFSHLTLDDELLGSNYSDNRFRIQWDVSF
jgi:phosphate-selective porin